MRVEFSSTFKAQKMDKEDLFLIMYDYFLYKGLLFFYRNRSDLWFAFEPIPFLTQDKTLFIYRMSVLYKTNSSPQFTS